MNVNRTITKICGTVVGIFFMLPAGPATAGRSGEEPVSISIDAVADKVELNRRIEFVIEVTSVEDAGEIVPVDVTLGRGLAVGEQKDSLALSVDIDEDTGMGQVVLSVLVSDDVPAHTGISVDIGDGVVESSEHDHTLTDALSISRTSEDRNVIIYRPSEVIDSSHVASRDGTIIELKKPVDELVEIPFAADKGPSAPVKTFTYDFESNNRSLGTFSTLPVVNTDSTRVPLKTKKMGVGPGPQSIER